MVLVSSCLVTILRCLDFQDLNVTKLALRTLTNAMNNDFGAVEAFVRLGGIDRLLGLCIPQAYSLSSPEIMHLNIRLLYMLSTLR